jgi:purine-binding chemotaxis protein CheW
MTTTYMTFGLGEALFALPVTLVQEILDVRPVSRMPNAPPHFLALSTCAAPPSP